MKKRDYRDCITPMPLLFIGAAYVCRLSAWYFGAVVLGSLLSMPFLIHLKRREQERKNRRTESDFYMEQMIYSFRRHKKIVAALEDVSAVSEGRLRQKILSARACLEGTGTESGMDNMFDSALSGLEETYGYEFLRQLHRFLIRVEEQGGDCSMALSLLLDQLRGKKKEEAVFQEKKQKVRSRLTLAILLSLLICTMVMRMMPSVKTVTGLAGYQWGTTLGLLSFQLLYLVFAFLFSRVSLEKADKAGRMDDRREETKIRRLYRRLDSPLHGPRYRMTVYRLEREVRKVFPEWLFDMMLRLQTETVATAVSHSLDTAPFVLVEPLYQLSREQQKDPVSLQPFTDFLKELDIPEIHAVMRQLYAINHMGTEQIQEQIHAMLDQNRRMSETAVQLKADTLLFGMGMLAVLPMLISVLVLVLDLSLMLLVFLKEMYSL